MPLNNGAQVTRAPGKFDLFAALMAEASCCMTLLQPDEFSPPKMWIRVRGLIRPHRVFPGPTPDPDEWLVVGEIQFDQVHDAPRDPRKPISWRPGDVEPPYRVVRCNVRTLRGFLLPISTAVVFPDSFGVELAESPA